jgi:hypothetical protein
LVAKEIALTKSELKQELGDKFSVLLSQSFARQTPSRGVQMQMVTKSVSKTREIKKKYS